MEKEMYEPIWEEVVSRLGVEGIRVRSVWIADSATQSASGMLNAELLGNDREFPNFCNCRYISFETDFWQHHGLITLEIFFT